MGRIGKGVSECMRYLVAVIAQSVASISRGGTAMKLNNPIVIGFGISGKETFNEATKYGRGAIIGSAFVKLLGKSKNLSVDIKEFIAQLH